MAKELIALFKGSTLENPKPFLAQNGQNWKDGELADRSEAGIIATLLGPAMLKEAKKFQGLAFAITGFDANGDAEFIAVLKPGASQLPDTLLRSFLQKNPALKKITTFEGVDIFQDNGLMGIPNELLVPGGLVPEPPPSLPRFALAQTAGLVIVASNKEQITTALRRWKEKDKSASFTSSEAFKEVIEGRKRPGLFAYMNAKGLASRMEPFLRSNRPVNSTAWVAVKELVPPALIKSLTAHVSFSAGAIRCSIGLNFVSGKSVPLLDFLNGQSIGIQQLQSIPLESSLALTLAFPKGEHRLQKALAILDTLVKATGTLGATASELLEELVEKKPQTNPRRTFEKVSGLALLFPPLHDASAKALWPTVVLHMDDVESARSIETLLPAILEILSGELPQPITETIEGQKVRSVALTGSTLHYGTTKNRFAIGPDRKGLASTLIADKIQMSPDEKSLSRAALAAALRWDALLKNAPVGRSGSSAVRRYQLQALEDLVCDSRIPRRVVLPIEMPGMLVEHVRSLPPLWFTLRRQDDSIRVEWEQSAPKAGFAALITQSFEWYARMSDVNVRRAIDLEEPLRFVVP